MHPLTFDPLSGADLGGFAALGNAVDADRTRGNKLLAPPAAVGDAGEFQQVAQADVVVTQSEFTGFQEQVCIQCLKGDDTGTVARGTMLR